MSKLDRRRFVVGLLPGTFEQELVDLASKAISAKETEIQQGPTRTGQRSQAIALARQHDAKKAEAEQLATKVTVWALGYAELPALKEQHPPREEHDDDGHTAHPLDKMHGTNMATFPHALLCASLIEPGTIDQPDIQKRVGAMVEAGARVLDVDLDPSALHYKKLETAAWNVNMAVEQVPKESLVSLLTQASESASKELSEQESVPDDSPATSQPRRTGT